MATTNGLIHHACAADDGADGELWGPTRQRRQDDDDVLWYFSFGANMASRILNRRHVRPQRSTRATVTDPALSLLFDHVGGYANLCVRPKGIQQCFLGYSGPVEGVAHEITMAEFHELQKVEMGYDIMRLTVRLGLRPASVIRRGTEYEHFGGAAGGVAETVEAVTFVSRWEARLKESLPPPARYKAKLIEGAKEFGLSGTYIAWLESLPSVEKAPYVPIDDPRYHDTYGASAKDGAELPSYRSYVWSQEA